MAYSKYVLCFLPDLTNVTTQRFDGVLAFGGGRIGRWIGGVLNVSKII